MNNTIYAINGPVIKIRDTKDFAMREIVWVWAKATEAHIAKPTNISAFFIVV